MPPPRTVSRLPSLRRWTRHDRILTRIDPLHSIGVDVGAVLPSDTQTVGLFDRTVGVQVVTSISGVSDDGVSIDQAQPQKGEGRCPAGY